jgi:hypothetical protein
MLGLHLFAPEWTTNSAYWEGFAPLRETIFFFVLDL